MRSLFLASWTADIESRLKGMLRQIYLLEDPDAAYDKSEAARLVRRSCEELLASVSRVTDFTENGSETVRLAEEEFELHSVLRIAVARHVFTADHQGIRLSCLVHCDVPRRASGDAPRLRQVLSAFVENTIRSTDASEILVRISVDESTPDTLLLRFAIANARAASTGAALGSTLFGDLVSLMGGEVGPEDDGERWFTVALRAVPDAVSPTVAKTTATPPHRPVLLVSNNPDGIPEILLALQRNGYTVELEEDRKRFPVRLREREYGIVLMDADGGSQVATLATWPSGDKLRRVPIVGVPRMDGKREQIDEEALLRLVDRCIHDGH